MPETTNGRNGEWENRRPDFARSSSRPLAVSPVRRLAVSPSRPLAHSPFLRFTVSLSRPLALSPFRRLAGFTLIELLVVITIIAILAAAIIPNFVGFDTEARLAATQTNLNTLRTRITLFRAKEGRYPDALEALTSTTYDDMGITRLYLDQLPSEMISEKSGNATVENITSKDSLTGDGGWTYITNQAKAVIDVTEPLSSRWGSYEGQKPSDW